jgi:hypothetical protein
MATKKKMLQAAAGAAGGGQPLAIEDVFSTYLYTGNWLKPKRSPTGLTLLVRVGWFGESLDQAQLVMFYLILYGVLGAQ